MSDEKIEQITLGGGCFWCLEAPYQQLEGVLDVTSGYMGGKVKNPGYREVCSGLTGHAEVVRISFDPTVLSLNQIFEVFWTVHDPTTLNRQGNDVGSQYRSVIFYHTPAQEKTAREHIDKLEKAKVFSQPIVTEVKPAVEFYEAEDYHQDYYLNNPSQPYCTFIVKPKVEKVKRIFSDQLKK
jgi:peptide-methionine (S)-S-oxide reductase